METLDYLRFALWAFPPIAATLVYAKLMRLNSTPVFSSPAQICRAGLASFLSCVLLFGGALLMVKFFHDRLPAAYFGLAFPQPPG
jgi:hypothetical protein